MKPEGDDFNHEPSAVADRYERRAHIGAWRYDPLNPAVYMGAQERERALIRLLQKARLPPLADRTLIEIGCGNGANLLDLVRLGFSPRNLVGNELLPDRLATARERLPSSIRLLPGDALALDVVDESFDVVLQSTVFTSILDGEFQARLARRMWAWVKPGGGVIWYDFAYDNPVNRDVRGVPQKRVRELFPDGIARCAWVTLAPPISRLVTRVHPALYSVFNALPFLRTHRLCWIGKRPAAR